MAASNFDLADRKDVCLKTPKGTIEKTVFLCLSVLAMMGIHSSVKIHCKCCRSNLKTLLKS